ncbi:hypothetical protein HT031_005938 [Scenedesmus sp. PABB004]|nr:hypothetical protein HT031_005938 [Scenedesmus sp. PABB004]
MATLASSALSRRASALSGTAAAPRLGAGHRGIATTRRAATPLDILAAAGDVDAPIAVPLVAALVVTAAITFAVPAYLSRGAPPLAPAGRSWGAVSRAAPARASADAGARAARAGQQAADKIFAGKEKAPLDKKKKAPVKPKRR